LLGEQSGGRKPYSLRAARTRDERHLPRRVHRFDVTGF